MQIIMKYFFLPNLRYYISQYTNKIIKDNINFKKNYFFMIYYYWDLVQSIFKIIYFVMCVDGIIPEMLSSYISNLNV